MTKYNELLREIDNFNEEELLALVHLMNESTNFGNTWEERLHKVANIAYHYRNTEKC